MMGWQWHQLNHMQVICTSLQTDTHANTSSVKFLQAGCSSCHPTNSVKALKAICAVPNARHIDYMHDSYICIVLLSQTGMFCTVDEDRIEPEPQLNHQFLATTPKSSKENGRRNDRGWGFVRGLMDLFRLVIFTAWADKLFWCKNTFLIVSVYFWIDFHQLLLPLELCLCH